MDEISIGLQTQTRGQRWRRVAGRTPEGRACSPVLVQALLFGGASALAAALPAAVRQLVVSFGPHLALQLHDVLEGHVGELWAGTESGERHVSPGQRNPAHDTTGDTETSYIHAIISTGYSVFKLLLQLVQMVRRRRCFYRPDRLKQD